MSAVAQRRALPLLRIFFAVFGGPLAWFLQLNACFALASNPCFIDNARPITPNVAHGGTLTVIIALAVIGCLVSLAALSTAWRLYRLSQQEAAGGRELMEIGAGRTRFLALWGICFGLGSALVIVFTAIAFFVLPRCAA